MIERFNTKERMGVSTRSAATEPVRFHVERARSRPKPQSHIEQPLEMSIPPGLAMEKQDMCDVCQDEVIDDWSMIIKLPTILRTEKSDPGNLGSSSSRERHVRVEIAKNDLSTKNHDIFFDAKAPSIRLHPNISDCAMGSQLSLMKRSCSDLSLIEILALGTDGGTDSARGPERCSGDPSEVTS